jgi:PucR family transcriptional regulator, purine catabolism regulatory protein
VATLYEIWRLALPPLTTLHAGLADGASVRAVVLGRPTQPALPDLHGAEMVLIAPNVLESLRLSLGRLIERLHGSTVVALGFAGPVDPGAMTASCLSCRPAPTCAWFSAKPSACWPIPRPSTSAAPPSCTPR